MVERNRFTKSFSDKATSALEEGNQGTKQAVKGSQKREMKAQK